MAKSIKLKNNIYWDSKSISHNKKTLDNYLNKSILSATLTSNFYSTINTYVEINTWKEHLKVGSALNVVNGKIKVGTGISKIRISGQFGVYTLNEDKYYFLIKINGENANFWFVENLIAGFHNIPINMVLEVSEGDVISVALYKSQYGGLDADKSILIFEKIE